ncbi:hypothetical protein ACWNYH_00655 [Candidatus Vidania fulgoroideorum]
MITKHILIGGRINKSCSPKVYYQVYKLKKTPLIYKGISLNKKNLLNEIITILKINKAVINITIPYKELIKKKCNLCTLSSKKTGSINLIIRKKNTVTAYNTDISGFNFLLNKSVRIKKNIKVLIIGAGGAFKSLINQIKANKKIKSISLLNRTKSKYNSFLDSKTIYIKKQMLFNLIINTIPIYCFENFIKKEDLLSNKTMVLDLSYQKKNLYESCFKKYIYGEKMLYKQAIENLKTKQKNEK